MIHNSIPGAAVVSHNQVYQLYHGLRASGVSKPLFRLEKAPQHVHGSIPQNILSLKWTPTATTKSEKNSFLLYVCFVIFVFEFVFKTGTPFFPSYIRKKVFVMLLVVLCFHCVVILERLSVESLGFTGTKQTWLMSCVEKVLFPQAGWLPRVLKVSTTLQRNTTQRRSSAKLLHTLLVKRLCFDLRIMH